MGLAHGLLLFVLGMITTTAFFTVLMHVMKNEERKEDVEDVT